MKEDIKKIFLIKVLSFALWVCPNGDFKKDFAKFIVDNIEKL